VPTPFKIPILQPADPSSFRGVIYGTNVKRIIRCAKAGLIKYILRGVPTTSPMIIRDVVMGGVSIASSLFHFPLPISQSPSPKPAWVCPLRIANLGAPDTYLQCLPLIFRLRVPLRSPSKRGLCPHKPSYRTLYAGIKINRLI